MATLDILIKLRKVIRSIHLESKRIEKEYKISIPQLLALQHLEQKPNFQSTARDLKTFLKLNPSTISGIIGRLENKGLIARMPVLHDRRVTNIVLTKKGKKLLESAPMTIFERLNVELETLNEDELQGLHANLDFLVKAMGAEDIDAAPILTSQEFPSGSEQPEN